MRNTQDMISLKNSPRFKAAKIIFDDMLSKREPDINALISLHGEEIAYNVKRSIMKFYDDPKFTGGIIRGHDETAPTILSEMRKLIDEDKDFRDIDEYFVSTPCRDDPIDQIFDDINAEIGSAFKNKFGPYAQTAVRATALAMNCHLRRKSEVSSISHWVGAAGIMYFLQKHNHIKPYCDDHFRVIVAFLHDFNEDLPRKVFHSDGRPYGLNRTAEFGKDYLSNNKLILRDVDILTNLYTEMTKHVYDFFVRNGDAFTIGGFREYLHNLLKTEDEMQPMYNVHKKLYDLVCSNGYGTLVGKDLLSAISWNSYKFYIDQILAECNRYEDDTPIIAKFCDQNYNFIEKEILASRDLMKHLLKVWLWSTSVLNSEMSEQTKDFARELLEDALCYSEYYIIRDLMRRESIIAFHAVAYEKLKKLMPILYVDHNVFD